VTAASLMESDVPVLVVLLVLVCWAAFAWLRKVC
jgi:hypothetical protein